MRLSTFIRHHPSRNPHSIRASSSSQSLSSISIPYVGSSTPTLSSSLLLTLRSFVSKKMVANNPFVSSSSFTQQRAYSMISTTWAGKPLRLEVGRIGPLADAVVFASHGDTTILASAVSNTTMTTEDFLPLQVEYRERISAYGSIPSTNNRKEPTVNEKEILAARVIDRTLRPLFQKGYLYDTQIITTLQSYDPDTDPIALAIIASSAALHISPIPWDGPAAAVRVGLPSNYSSSSSSSIQPILSPNAQQSLDSPLEFLFAGADQVALMIEAEGKEIPESVIAQIIRYSQQSLTPLINMQNELRTMVGKPKRNLPLCLPSDDLLLAIRRVIYEEAKETFRKARNRKEDRSRAQGLLSKEAKIRLPSRFQNEDPRKISAGIEEIIREAMRDLVIESTKQNNNIPSPFPGPTITASSQYKLYDGDHGRVDGRSTKEIRKLNAAIDILPRVHGSGLFSRGDTQVLTTATLGPLDLALDIDLENSLQTQHINRQDDNNSTTATTPATVSSSVPPKSITSTPTTIGKRFFLHYDFPPYCTNEVSKMGGINRRMIGHGALAEKSLRAVLPKENDLLTWPYTVRVTSETTGSDGSSSMATVCGATLALMDAGVPISAPVAGISIGCMSPTSDSQEGMKPGDSYVLLTDIFGLEDHAGDMDFKIAGTRKGITGIQLDMKPAGLPVEVLEAAVWRAKDARYQILDVISNAIPEVRKELKLYTPKAEILELPSELRPKIIGPGGSNLRRTERLSGAKIVPDPDMARLYLYANSKDMEIAKTVLFAAAQEQLRAIGSPLTVHLQPRKLPTLIVGVPIRAQILRITEFGVVIGLNNEEIGWMHISEFARHRSHKVNEYFTEGDEVTVQVCDVDAKGRGRFSIKALLNAGEDISKYIIHKSTTTTTKSNDNDSSKINTTEKEGNTKVVALETNLNTKETTQLSTGISTSSFSTTLQHVKAGNDTEVMITRITPGGISLGVLASNTINSSTTQKINSSTVTINGLSIIEIGWMARATLPLPKSKQNNLQELFTIGDVLRLRVVRGTSTTTGHATFSIRPLLKGNETIEALVVKYNHHSTPIVSIPNPNITTVSTSTTTQSTTTPFTISSSTTVNPHITSITAPSVNTIWREFNYLDNGIIQSTNLLRSYNLLPVNNNPSKNNKITNNNTDDVIINPIVIPVVSNDNLSTSANLTKVVNNNHNNTPDTVSNQTTSSSTSTSTWTSFSTNMQQQNVLKGIVPLSTSNTTNTNNNEQVSTTSAVASKVKKSSSIISSTKNKHKIKDFKIEPTTKKTSKKTKNNSTTNNTSDMTKVNTAENNTSASHTSKKRRSKESTDKSSTNNSSVVIVTTASTKKSKKTINKKEN